MSEAPNVIEMRLDLRKTTAKPTARLVLRYGESDATKLTVTVTDGGSAVDVASHDQIALLMLKPDSTVYTQVMEAGNETGVCSCTLAAQAATAVGRGHAYVVIRDMAEDGSGWEVYATTREFAVHVLEGIDTSYVDESTDWSGTLLEMEEAYWQALQDAVAAHQATDQLSRVTSLDGTVLATGAVVEAVGAPTYVSDVSGYEAYGMTDVGWYVFARITVPDGATVGDATAVTGALAVVTSGADHVDVAVPFEVAAMSARVTVAWDASTSETFTFKATDLAVRNLDYRTTFYVYDIAPYTTWAYKVATDSTFVGTEYWAVDESADLGYSRAAVAADTEIPEGEYFTHSYALTTDETFQDGTTYYTLSGSTYTEAEVTTGDAVTASTYYVDVWTEASGYFVGTAYWVVEDGGYARAEVVAGETVPTAYYVVDEVAYALTTDETFVDGTTYYVLSDGEYTAAEVTTGDAVTADTYYVVASTTYALTTDTEFAEGTTYYTLSGSTYSAAEVTAGDAVPTVYYVHSSVTFEGMVRNVTYKCDTPIDCPSVFVLPEIEDDGYGCWYEAQLRNKAVYSLTLQLEDEDAKVATNGVVNLSKGANILDLHYTGVADAKVWRATNINSNFSGA